MSFAKDIAAGMVRGPARAAAFSFNSAAPLWSRTDTAATKKNAQRNVENEAGFGRNDRRDLAERLPEFPR